MATSQEIYRDLADNAKLDGRYTSSEIERAFKLPSQAPDPAARRPISAPEGVAIAATGSQLDASTPATSTPEFWIALFLFAVLVWWCVDRIVRTRRQR
jgi:hypothetical protein